MTLEKEHIEKLKYVAEWLEVGAPHEDGGMAFYMDTWHSEGVDSEQFEEPWIGKCGSVACIGGALEQFFGVNGEHDPEGLGMTHKQARNLFYPWNKSSYREGSGNLSPENCAKVIYHLIETGEVDWSII